MAVVVAGRERLREASFVVPLPLPFPSVGGETLIMLTSRRRG